MKRLAPLAVAWGVACAAAPFSHRAHLAFERDCVTCHVAAPRSTRADDNLLPPKSLCLNCHDQAEIGPPPVTLVTKFSHALHLKMGKLVAPLIAGAIDSKTYLQPPDDIRRHLNSPNPCEACHRGLEESDRVSRAAMPRMADCLVCHTEIDPPFSCEDCHSRNAPLKPASHTGHFLDTHSSGKLQLDKSTCAVCHGRTFTCMGCH